LLLVLYVGAALLLRAMLDPQALADWAEPRAETALNRDVELEGIRLTFFPGLGADITGVEVRNLPEFGGPPLLEVDRVRLRVALRPLLRRRIEVSNVRIDGPVLRLLVDAEGRTNFGEFAPPGDEPPDAAPGAPPVDVALRSLRLSGGRVEYESIPDSLAVVLNDITARASLELLRDGNWSVASETQSPEVLVLHPALGTGPRAFRSVGLEADARAGPEMAWLEIDRGTLRLEEADFSLTGRVEDLTEPIRTVDLALRAEGLDVPRFLSFLPEEMTGTLPGRPEGVLDVIATLQGAVGVDVRPDLRGTVDLRDGGLRTPGGDVVAEGVSGQVALHNDSLGIQELSGRALNGPFSLSASVQIDSLLPFRADLRATPQLDRIHLVAELPQGTDLGGRAEVGLSLRGMSLDPASVSVDGTVDLRDFRGVFPELAVPVGIPTGRLSFAGQGVSWQGMEVVLDQDRVTTWGMVREYLAGLTGPEGSVPRLEMTVTSGRLDMDRLFPPQADTAITYGQIAFARLGGRTINGQDPEELARQKGFVRPDSLPVAGQMALRVDTLISAPFRLIGVDATIEFSPSLIQVAEARAGLFGGRIRTGGVVGLGPEPEQPFTFSLGVEGVQAAEFLSTTSPVGEYVRGLLGLELEASGSLDEFLLPNAATLAADGRIQVAEGQLMEMPVTRLLSRSLSRPELASPRFRDWAGRFHVEGSRLTFEETVLALGTQDGEMRFGGVIGLDGGLDLAVRLAAPAARLDSLALAQTGFLAAAAGALTPREGPVRLGLRIHGTLTEPRISPEASLALGDLRQTLEAEARERAQELQAEAERRFDEARDTVQARVDEVRDTAQARVDAVRDTAQALRDTAEARIEAERRRAEEQAREEAQRELERRGRGLLQRIRPDPTPADTVRPDTIRPDTLAGDTIPRDTIPRDTLRTDARSGAPGGVVSSGPGGRSHPPRWKEAEASSRPSASTIRTVHSPVQSGRMALELQVRQRGPWAVSDTRARSSPSNSQTCSKRLSGKPPSRTV